MSDYKLKYLNNGNIPNAVREVEENLVSQIRFELSAIPESDEGMLKPIVEELLLAFLPLKVTVFNNIYTYWRLYWSIRGYRRLLKHGSNGRMIARAYRMELRRAISAYTADDPDWETILAHCLTRDCMYVGLMYRNCEFIPSEVRSQLSWMLTQVMNGPAYNVSAGIGVLYDFVKLYPFDRMGNPIHPTLNQNVDRRADFGYEFEVMSNIS